MMRFSKKGERKMKNKLIAILMLFTLISSMLMIAAPIIPISASSGPAETREVSQAVQLTTDSHYDRDSSFFEAQDGTYWLFFTRETDTSGIYDIYYTASTDEGESWSTPVNLTAVLGRPPTQVEGRPFTQRDVAAFQDSDGNIWLFTSDGNKPNRDVTYWIYDGGSWSGWYSIANTMCYHLDALQASDGNIWVFYDGRAQGHLWCTYFDGSTWSAPEELTTSAAWIPKAIEDATGNLRVVCTDYTNVYLLTFDGTNWSVPATVVSTVYYDCDPTICQDRNGVYWVFWAPWDGSTDACWLECVYSGDCIT